MISSQAVSFEGQWENALTWRQVNEAARDRVNSTGVACAGGKWRLLFFEPQFHDGFFPPLMAAW